MDAYHAYQGGLVLHSGLCITKDRTLTSDALKAIADRGVFVVVDPEVLSDKAKADLLAKGLSALQIFRVLVERVVRKASCYPLTVCHPLRTLALLALFH